MGNQRRRPEGEEAPRATHEHAEPRPDPSAASGRQAGSLEQVRELLFGAIYRELERKIQRTDAHVSSRAEELQQETKRRTEALEKHIAGEIESLIARLEKEHTERSDGERRAEREHRDAVTRLEERVGELEDALVRAQREAQKELLAQTNRFLDELHRHRTEISAMLEHEIALLHEEAPDLPATEGPIEAAPPPAH